MKKVAVAMSGGVDSAVAALLLKREGYDVTGITLKLFEGPDDSQAGPKSCCSLSSVEDARRTAGIVGVPHYVLNFKKQFEEHVIEPFCDAYARGLTPNPCVECNRWVKFHFLLDMAYRMGFDLLATGHYAVKTEGANGPVLRRGADPVKDQTYFLYMLTRLQLDHLLFPTGPYMKSEIREIAREAGLPVAEKGDSQEICFVTQGAYGDFIASRNAGAAREGEIRDRAGNVLGTHPGIVNFTVGQRRGLGVSAPEPMYVLDLDAKNNVVIAGRWEELFSSGLDVEDAVFSGDMPNEGEELQVQFRYNAPPVKARFFNGNGAGFRTMFHEPQRAIAPGQAAVLYRGDEMLGGGTIVRAVQGER